MTFRVLSVNFFESHELSTLSVDVFYLNRGRMIYKHSSVDAHISQSSLLFHIDFILYFIFSISLFDTLVTVTAPITVSVPIAITKQGFHLLGSDFLNSIVFFSFFSLVCEGAPALYTNNPEKREKWKNLYTVYCI